MEHRHQTLARTQQPLDPEQGRGETYTCQVLWATVPGKLASTTPHCGGSAADGAGMVYQACLPVSIHSVHVEGSLGSSWREGVGRRDRMEGCGGRSCHGLGFICPERLKNNERSKINRRNGLGQSWSLLQLYHGQTRRGSEIA